MNNLVLINNKELQVKEFNGQRVITFKEIDKVHERVEGTAKRNFNENKKHFEENVDYFIAKPSDFEKYEIRTLEISNRGLTLITESGYLMLVKSLTDDLAWKVQRELVNKYFKIKEVKQLTAMDQLRLQYQVLEDHQNKINTIESKVIKLENNMTIDYAQQEELNSLAKVVVVRILGGKGTPAYKELNKKAFCSLWRDYKRIMGVNSYKNTSVKKFQVGKELIGNWKPDRELELMIKGANSQITFNNSMSL